MSVLYKLWETLEEGDLDRNHVSLAGTQMDAYVWKVNLCILVLVHLSCRRRIILVPPC